MKKSIIFFALIILSGSLYLIKDKYNDLSLMKNGEKIEIIKGDYNVPLNCEYSRHGIFLNFILEGKDYSKRIKSVNCYEIKKLESLVLITNKDRTKFFLPNEDVESNFKSFVLIFIILLIAFIGIFKSMNKKK